MSIIEEFIINSRSLTGNVINENLNQKNAVYLPANYYKSDKKYPVAYFLHGFSQSYRQIYKFKSVLDKFMRAEDSQFIFVSVNGQNKLGGSFWADSPVIGNWSDYFMQEVVAHVDENYRTLNNASSRAVCGFSMGAGASICLSMQHPEIFQTAYALCPGVLGSCDFMKAITEWAESVKNAFAAVFSYDLSAEFPHGIIPSFNGSKSDEEIILKWKDAFPGSDKRIKEYLQNKNRLKALRIDYASRDEYKWLVCGAETLSATFASVEIPHILKAHDITHEINLNVVENSMLPFLRDNLLFQK